jgi:hypothetical protein
MPEVQSALRGREPIYRPIFPSPKGSILAETYISR